MDTPWDDALLSVEDMPNEEMKIVATLCGIKTAMKLMKNLPGVTIYIPTKGIKILRDNYIYKAYDGSRESVIKLCRMLRITQKQVRNIIRKRKKEQREKEKR